MKIEILRIFLIVTFLLLVGCDSKYGYYELKMPKKNPTSYIFNFSIDVIKIIIKQNHEKMPLKYIESAEDSSIVWGEYILRKPENKNDFYLMNMLPSDTSIIYYRVIDETVKTLPYIYSIHLHITSLDSSKTLVNVITIRPRICIGVRFPYNVLPISEPDASLMKIVAPSTIEEYTVLLVIGEALGMKDKMPTLILPEQPRK
ncbi:MAG: hypothetical protein HZB59_00410 [Ignavibacteriales bacterium]|nr:hypothetical protein [Ignavibacteriales bacterium]